MSQDWTREEIEIASRQMKKQGELSFEEFQRELKNGKQGSQQRVSQQTDKGA